MLQSFLYFLDSSTPSPASKRQRVVELRPNSQLLVPYLDTSSDISSFHDDSQHSISSTESTSSNSEFEVRMCECECMNVCECVKW
jgi:hypothetical protein